MKEIEIVKDEGKTSGKRVSIQEDFPNQNPSESALSSYQSFTLGEILSPTEVQNIIFGPPTDGKEKPKTFIVSQNSKKSKKTKTNPQSCENFNYLETTDIKPKNDYLNKKRKKDNLEEDTIPENFPQTEINKKAKKEDTEDNFINGGEKNNNNLMNSILKPFCRLLVEFIEEIGNIKKKLKLGNLKSIFHGAKYNRKVLDLLLFQVICFEGREKNYQILRKAKPGENKLLFEYILNQKLKVLLQYFYDNSKIFDVSDIGKFPKIDEMLREKLKNESKEVKEVKIHNTKLMTKIILLDFKHHIFDERKPNGKEKKTDIDSMPIKKIKKFKIQEEYQEDDSINKEEKFFQEIVANLIATKERKI